MIKTLILFFGLLLLPESDNKTAIKYYKELGYTCVPQNLKDSIYTQKVNDSTYIMKKDLNNIPWVVGVK